MKQTIRSIAAAAALALSLAACSTEAEDDSGAALWARSTTQGTGGSAYTATLAAVDGSVYAAGYLIGAEELLLGNGVAVAGPCTATNALLVQYDSSGIPIRAVSTLSGDGTTYLFDIDPDDDGNIYAAGRINDTETYDFGNGVAVKGTAAEGGTQAPIFRTRARSSRRPATLSFR